MPQCHAITLPLNALLIYSGPTVVVPGREGFELVIVAARASDREAQKRLADCADDIIELIVAIRHLVGGFIIPMPETQKACGDVSVYGGVWQLVACDLFKDKAVEGFIVIQRFDDIVAVAPYEGFFCVTLVPVAVCVASDIQPVAGPAFAVLGAGE